MKAIPALLDQVKNGFAMRLDGIHGIAHWARVRENGLRLAQLTGANPDVVELFALLHDSKRLHDGRDWDHGRRAADYIRALRAGQAGPTRLDALGDADAELLAFACEHHTDGLIEAHVTVQTCWDADRLDLGRIGIRPDPARLCTPAARDPATIEWAWQHCRQDRPWTWSTPDTRRER